MSPELTGKKLFRPYLLCAALSLLSYHWGACRLVSPTWWIVELGAVGLLLAEFGAFLARDYYFYRRHRGLGVAAHSISAQIEPPQLVLKGAWGSYLLAFGFTLIVSIQLFENNWKWILSSFLIFMLGYYEGSPPIFWRRFRLASLWVGQVSSVLPFLMGILISDRTLDPIDLAVIGVLYALRVTVSWVDSALR